MSAPTDFGLPLSQAQGVRTWRVGYSYAGGVGSHRSHHAPTDFRSIPGDDRSRPPDGVQIRLLKPATGQGAHHLVVHNGRGGTSSTR